MKMPYRLIIEDLPDEDGGGWLAYFPTVGAGVAYGCAECGDFAGLNVSLRDGVIAYLKHMKKAGLPLPRPSDVDVAWCKAHGDALADILRLDEAAFDFDLLDETESCLAANNNYAFAA